MLAAWTFQTAHPPAFTMADAEATYSAAASEKHDTGEVAVELEDIEGDWQRPSFSLAEHSVGVFEDGTLVAAGEVYKGRRGEAAVHPTTAAAASVRGSCAGPRSARAVAAARSSARPALPAAPRRGCSGRSGTDRDGRRGCSRFPPDARSAPQPLPDGYRLRDFVPDHDDEVAFRIIEDAFNEWPDRQPSTLGDWSANTVKRPGFEPAALRLVDAPEGEPSAPPSRS